jgi:haloalkane dehalogenase
MRAILIILLLCVLTGPSAIAQTTKGGFIKTADGIRKVSSTTSKSGEMNMNQPNPKPFAEKKFIEIKGKRMAYIDEGEGIPIIFQHGNPTSSYLWRNVMREVAGQGRLIACDLIGMGDSEKLDHSGPESYSYKEQREFLFALWDKLNLGNEVILVLHDWGSALGFDWAYQNQKRVKGIVYMEALVKPSNWATFPEQGQKIFKALRTPGVGEEMVLKNNFFIEQLLFTPGMGVMRKLSEEEKGYYRKPFLNPGEDRRPTLSWPRQISIDGEPKDVTEIVKNYSEWLAKSSIPKLYVHGVPGAINAEGSPAYEFCRKWPNQKEIEVPGLHFIQEDSGPEIGKAVAEFVRSLRGVKQ